MPKRILFMIPTLFVLAMSVGEEPTNTLEYGSAFMRVALAPDQPAFVTLALDSLGKNKLSVSPLRSPARSGKTYQLRHLGPTFEYRPAGVPSSAPPAWTFEFSTRQMHLHSAYSAENPPPPLVMDFDLQLCHATLLGLMSDDGSIRLPALLHLPDHGTLRITSPSAQGLSLGYELVPPRASRQKVKFVRVTFPSASEAMPRIDYTLEVVAIHPQIPGLDRDARFDGFRRNFLNIFQLSPHFRTLANNAASDACAITVFEYAEVALHTPPLAQGLTALDLLRQTLDRYLGGAKGCGMKGYNGGTPYETGHDFLDANPSLVIAGADYVLGSKDEAWLRANYAGLQAWAGKMLDFDSDGDGLLEYPWTRQSGPWPGNPAANWWDAIWFTNKDAYSNALAYRACLDMAKVARLAGKRE
ncbi:MAG: hypothetical protein LAP13_12475, partial [Acidobacteriia bacterium]|nr:hypothetical protein [Terriglobia bacterium]